MRIAVLSGLILSVGACSGTAAKPTVTTVSPSTIAGLPPGQAFEVDLTRGGTVYKFEGPGIDFSRVSVLTTAGTRNFGEQLKGANTSLEGGITLGRPGDLRDHLPTKT
ncbi:MAG TPA: hypothetical protein VMQ62_00040, partial [Dongiaceae bacterium]|nr:hypothetical protein [Dongiaceae bacterium]